MSREDPSLTIVPDAASDPVYDFLPHPLQPTNGFLKAHVMLSQIPRANGISWASNSVRGAGGQTAVDVERLINLDQGIDVEGACSGNDLFSILCKLVERG